MENPMIEMITVPEGTQQKTMLTHNRVMVGTVGQFAVELVRTMCLAGKEAGETSTGEPKIELYTPQEIVTRAFELVELTISELQTRGWSVDLPPIGDLLEERSTKTGFTAP